MDAPVSEELRGVALPGFKKDRQIGAHLDLVPLVKQGIDQRSEVGVELGSSTGQVNPRSGQSFGHFKDTLHGLPGHNLATIRRSFDVAMAAA